jgi:hypothetical protein
MITFVDIAKALIQDAEKRGIASHFDFSSMDRLAEQLRELFILKRDEKTSLKNVSEYVKKL